MAVIERYKVEVEVAEVPVKSGPPKVAVIERYKVEVEVADVPV